MEELARAFHGPVAMAIHSLTGPSSGSRSPASSRLVFSTAPSPTFRPRWQLQLRVRLPLLDNKYYFDWFNEKSSPGRAPGRRAAFEGRRRDDHRRHLRQRQREDRGPSRSSLRHIQTGYLYRYALAMIVGLAVLVGWLVFKT